MDYNKNISKLYLITFCQNLIPAYVIERLFWQERGMTVIMVVLCEIIYAVTIVICEVPTGVLADKYGRKVPLVTGGFLSMLEMLILLFAHSFFTFAFAIFCAGIAGACVSGALHALLYDSLKLEREQKFEQIVGRLNSVDFISAMLAALTGSVLAKVFAFEFNYLLSVISMGLAFLITLFLKEPPIKDITESINGFNFRFFDYIKKSFFFLLNQRKLMIILIQGMAIAACITYLDEFWQLYLHEAGFSVLFFGLFLALISMARIPGNLLAARLLNKFRAEEILLVVLMFMTFGFLLVALFPGWFGSVVIIMIFLVSGVVEPVVSGHIHHLASSKIRATVQSILSLMESTFTFSVGMGFGIIATKLSIITGFLFLGFVSFICLIWFVLKGRRIFHTTLKKA